MVAGVRLCSGWQDDSLRGRWYESGEATPRRMSPDLLVRAAAIEAEGNREKIALIR
jgi:hypothetical protein